MISITSHNDSVAGVYRQTIDLNSKPQTNQTQLIKTLGQVTINVDDIPANNHFSHQTTPEQNFLSQLKQPTDSALSNFSTHVDTDIEQGISSSQAQTSQSSVVISIPDNDVEGRQIAPRTASPTPSETSNTACCLINMPTYTEEIAAESNIQWAHRHGKNLGLTVARNVVSVAVPTAARELMRRSVVPSLFTTLPKYAAPCAGALALGVPVVTVLAALVRDLINGTQTKESVISQLTLLGFNVAAGALLVASGGFTGAIEALVAAVFIYVPVRDALQFFVKLSDNNPEGFSLKATALAAGCYTVNQTIVDKCMDLSSELLGSSMGGIAAHMIGRSAVNTVGETIDELCFRSLDAWAKNNAHLELKLDFFSQEDMTWDKFKRMMFNTLSSRASLFSSGFAFGFAKVAPSIPDCIKTGISLGLGYMPFVFAHAQKINSPAEDSRDIELSEFSYREGAV